MIRSILKASFERLSAAAGVLLAPPLGAEERRELLELRAYKAAIDRIERAPGHDSPLFVDYPPTERPRYGYGKPPHPELYALLAEGRDSYRTLLHDVLGHAERLVKIPVHDSGQPGTPHWLNGWIPGLDSSVLYTLLGRHNPRRYLEVGSGHSTRFARRAISDLQLRTQITSIDPQPRAEIDALCDRVIRAPVESIDLALFATLEAGDLLFIDNSHRTFMNSDATVCFMEILPRLKPGVLVHFHDILLPDDYPPEWGPRHYSEQYLLACYLLGGGKNVRVLMANRFVTNDPELGTALAPLWNRLPGAEAHGGSFWLTIT